MCFKRKPTKDEIEQLKIDVAFFKQQLNALHQEKVRGDITLQEYQTAMQELDSILCGIERRVKKWKLKKKTY